MVRLKGAAKPPTDPHLPCIPLSCRRYADRAKEIKTHVVQNVGTVESHIADYQRMIDALQVCVCSLFGPPFLVCKGHVMDGLVGLVLP